jgi:pimeloyl-ACP methyl ester carboxylesterase
MSAKSGYVDANGVHTYYDVQGDGEPLLLLHGGFATNETWGPLVPALAERYRVIAPERRGHGHTPDVPGPITYELMTDDTIAFIDAVGIGPAHVLGWSDGGMIGIKLASGHPEQVRKLIVYGAGYSDAGYPPGAIDFVTKGHPDDPDVAILRAGYEAVSPDGADHFPVVFAKLADLWRASFDYSDDLQRLAMPTLLLCADDDLITLPHIVSFYDRLPNGQLAIIPGTSHTACLERPRLFAEVVLEFLAADQPTPFLPYRRSQQGAHG